MSQTAQQLQDDTFQCVTFRMADEVYGVNVMLVQEVLRYTEIVPVPGAPHHVLGIVNLRGNVVTVIDTRARLGLPTTEMTENTRILIIEINGNVIGMVVDSVSEVLDIKSSDIESAPNVGNDESSKYIQGVVNREDFLLIVVDMNRLIGEENLSGLAEM